MENKVVLIIVDGMRSDSLEACKNPYVGALLSQSLSTLSSSSVMPSVTLPCHMSVFYSADPERHGITTNIYTQQVRPIVGLVEKLAAANKKCAFFYTWEELRDCVRPTAGALTMSIFMNESKTDDPDVAITNAAIPYIKNEKPDFAFLYLGWTDIAGHNDGWMSKSYLEAVSAAFDCIQRVRNEIPSDYTIIVTADHGGHNRSHGNNIPEDMTIPLIINGPNIPKGATISQQTTLKDIAPTITSLLGVEPVEDWEGKAIL